MDERLAVEADYPAPPLAPAGQPNGPIDRMMDGQRTPGGIAEARDRLMGWVRSDPAVALGAAAGVGIVLGLTLGSYLRVGIPGLSRRR